MLSSAGNELPVTGATGIQTTAVLRQHKRNQKAANNKNKR
jgi:hypothetical protein